MLRRALPLVLLFVIAACGNDSPTGPTPPPTQTRILALNGALSFGDVEVGGEAFRAVTLTNQGNAPLTITRFTMTDTDSFAVSWTGGTIAAGGQQVANFRFRPTEARSYSGTITIVGDQTAGSSTMQYVGAGIRTGPVWERTGTGADVFDMPAGITRLRITGTYSGRCENFIVRVGNRTAVNVILGSCSVADSQNYEGTHSVSGTQVEVTHASGVNWKIAEVR